MSKVIHHAAHTKAAHHGVGSKSKVNKVSGVSSEVGKSLSGSTAYHTIGFKF